MEEFSVLLKVEGEDQKDQKSLFEGWEELHPFVFNACSLPSFQQVSGIGRIFFPYLARKKSLFWPTEACTKLSCFS